MPFARRLHMPTAGTRIAVYIFPAYTLYLGACYTFQPMSRMRSTAYTVAAHDTHIGMRGWGIVFLAVGLTQLACILSGTKSGHVLAMAAGMGLYATWATLFTASIFADSATSLTAPTSSLLALAGAVAFMQTLLRERG